MGKPSKAFWQFSATAKADFTLLSWAGHSGDSQHTTVNGLPPLPPFFVLPVDGGVLSMPHLSSYVIFGWTDGKICVICWAKKYRQALYISACFGMLRVSRYYECDGKLKKPYPYSLRQERVFNNILQCFFKTHLFLCLFRHFCFVSV